MLRDTNVNLKSEELFTLFYMYKKTKAYAINYYYGHWLPVYCLNKFRRHNFIHFGVK